VDSAARAVRTPAEAMASGLVDPQGRILSLDRRFLDFARNVDGWPARDKHSPGKVPIVT
jgi:hypothetical protein